MRFLLLGPVEIHSAAGPVSLPGTKIRTVLATFLLSRGEVISDDQLAGRLWARRPPSTATAQIHSYVSRLRRTIGGHAEITRHRSDGYTLRLDTATLDLADFERAAVAGRAALAATRFDEAAAALRQALALWRGPALGGASDQLIDLDRPCLEENRLGVLEDRIEADLALGRHGEVVTELARLVAAHPVRERLYALFMLALFRSGRQAEALRAYQQCRRCLAEELGIDPGAELQQVHAAVLAGTPAGSPTAAAPTPPVPAEIPAAPADFTGRDKAVNEVCALLGADPAGPGAPTVCSIEGMAGVGKSALAVQVAHRMRPAYPDGQLWLDLRGSTTTPVPPPDVQRRVVSALLGYPAAGTIDPDGLQRYYRSLLADRRLLLVLDDAADERQVRPLLAGAAGTAVLVTSQTCLAGLDGVRPVELGVPDGEAALRLLLGIIGPERGLAEPHAAEQIVELCGRVPLAIRIAGAQLRSNPQWTLERLVARLSPETERLAVLAWHDLELLPRLEPTYRRLSVHARRTFRLLGLPDAVGLTMAVAAVVTDLPLERAAHDVDELVRARLVGFTGARTFRFRPLARALARTVAATEETPESRARALDRYHHLTRTPA